MSDYDVRFYPAAGKGIRPGEANRIAGWWQVVPRERDRIIESWFVEDYEDSRGEHDAAHKLARDLNAGRWDTRLRGRDDG
jgi:hypothetical protein